MSMKGINDPFDAELAAYILYMNTCVTARDIRESVAKLNVKGITVPDMFRILSCPKNQEELKLAKKFWSVRKTFVSGEIKDRIENGFNYNKSNLKSVLDMYIETTVKTFKETKDIYDESEAILSREVANFQFFEDLGFYEDKELSSEIISQFNIMLTYFLNEYYSMVNDMISEHLDFPIPAATNLLDVIVNTIAKAIRQDTIEHVTAAFAFEINKTGQIVLCDTKNGNEPDINTALNFLDYFEGYIKSIGPQRKKDQNNA